MSAMDGRAVLREWARLIEASMMADERVTLIDEHHDGDQRAALVASPFPRNRNIFTFCCLSRFFLSTLDFEQALLAESVVTRYIS